MWSSCLETPENWERSEWQAAVPPGRGCREGAAGEAAGAAGRVCGEGLGGCQGLWGALQGKQDEVMLMQIGN